MAFKSGGAVWAEMQNALRSDDPILHKWFGYIADTARPNRELFAQIGALKARFPEKASEYFPKGSAAHARAASIARGDGAISARAGRSEGSPVPGLGRSGQAEGGAGGRGGSPALSESDAPSKPKRQVVKKDGSTRPASLDDRTEDTKEAYERRIDELFDGAAPNDDGVRVLDEGDLMTILGFSPAEVRLDEHHTTGSGQRSGKYNHDVPKEVFKQLPEMLDNPVAVFDYPSAGGRDKRFIGVDQQGRAWVIGVNAGGKSRSSGLRSAHVAVTAFGVEETLPVRTMARDNQLVYLDQKKALTFNRGLPGLKLPDTSGGNARASGSEGYTHQKLPTSVDEARKLSDRTVLTEKRLARYRQQRAEQRAVSLPDTAEDAPPPRKRKQVFKTAPKAQAAVDAGATVAPEVSAKAAESIGSAKHNYTAEKSLLKELAKAVGVPFIRRVSGLAEKRGAQVGGKYVSTRDIQVNDNLAGNERMSVLLHEFGHHVVVSKIARALGIDPDAVARMGSDELLAAFDQYRPDVAAEYLPKRVGAFCSCPIPGLQRDHEHVQEHPQEHLRRVCCHRRAG